MSEEKQATFTYLLALVLFAGVVFVYFATQSQYAHERPQVDCTRPYDYPACWLDEQWTAMAAPSLGAQLAGLALVGVLSLVLIVWAWKASVTSEVEIAAPGSQGASTQATLPPLPPAAESARTFAGGRAPETIPGNAIPREMIASPTAAPRKAPDLKKLEGKA